MNNLIKINTHNIMLVLNKIYRKFQLTLSPQQNLLYGFLIYTLLGWLLLSLPFSNKVQASWLDNLFVASSAISTTGLSTISIADTYNLFGQLIVLLLIQIGGIGYMTFTSFILLSNANRLTHWHQRVLNAEFSLPKEFELRNFLKSVIIFTIIIETFGALGLYIAFIQAGVEHNFAIWSSIFHSVSSFCTAGFGLYNDSFMKFRDNVPINIIISVLSILGSLGFIFITDIWNRLTRRTNAITYTTKVIIGVTVLLTFLGTIMIYYFEPSVSNLGDAKLMVSFFQAMTALTTVGFNTIPIGNLTLSVLLFVIFLMFVGASPSGTGGGLKTTTLTALAAIMWSRIRNNNLVSFFGRTIPSERLNIATTVFMFYTSLLFLSTFLLSITEDFDLRDILFETTSAIGTVGLSTGITAALSPLGKLIITLTMFVGRLGVLTFGLAILARKRESKRIPKESDLVV